MIVRVKSLELFFYFLISLFYGYIFILIPHDYFKDRLNYLSYAENYDFFISLKEDSSYLIGEILFLYINKFFSIFFSPENVVYLFVFIVNFTLCFVFFFSYKRKIFPFFILLAYFLLPFGFSYQLGSLRQSLAISIFLFAVCYIKKVNIYLIVISIILGMIHTSFFIVTLFLFADYIFLKFFSEEKLFYRIGLHLFLAVILGLFLSLISNLFSVNKLDDYLEYDSGGGLFFLFFIPFFVANIYRYYKSKAVDYFVFLSIIGVLIYIVLYFLSPISGRVITIFLPFIFLSLINRVDIINICLLIYSLIVGSWLFLNGGYMAIMNI